MLVTVSNGSTHVPAYVELLPARVLMFETLRALTIMLEVDGAMEECNSRVAYVTMNFENLFWRKEILSKAFNT